MPARPPDGNGKEKIQGLEILMNTFLKLKPVIEERDELAMQLRICVCLLSEVSSGSIDTLQKDQPKRSLISGGEMELR